MDFMVKLFCVRSHENTEDLTAFWHDYMNCVCLIYRDTVKAVECFMNVCPGLSWNAPIVVTSLRFLNCK